MTVHRQVARLAQLGWWLHPVSQYSRAAYINDATELATCDLNQLDRWSWEFPGCDWRVVMQGGGIWALDVDVAGADHVADRVHGRLPPAPTTRSGGSGSVLFLSHTVEPIIGKTGTQCLGSRSMMSAPNRDVASVAPSQDGPTRQLASDAMGRFTATCPVVAVAACRAVGGACGGCTCSACRPITNATVLRCGCTPRCGDACCYSTGRPA